ncbi:MAG: acyl carrier protein [Oscillospiraceae bacterium]|nr:acyl carrier protein [Oscillospiraceae bacterium]
MKEEIIRIVERLTDHPGITLQTDLMDEDILDSLAFLELIEELEDRFQIEIQPTQIPAETWRTVVGIAAMVERYQQHS